MKVRKTRTINIGNAPFSKRWHTRTVSVCAMKKQNTFFPLCGGLQQRIKHHKIGEQQLYSFCVSLMRKSLSPLLLLSVDLLMAFVPISPGQPMLTISNTVAAVTCVNQYITIRQMQK